MRDFFKAEFRRFLRWALFFAGAQLMALAFLGRMVDLAQQPAEVYGVFAAVNALAGLLLGLYQMGGYRRPNAWLQLLHRPLAPWRIALALLAAGALLLAIAIALPLLASAAWQAWMTPRVLDLRHVWLCAAGYGIGLMGYLSGASAMLLPRRTAAAPLVFLALLPAAYATGLGALALQGLALAWLLALALAAFKPDLDVAPRGARALLLAVPMQVLMWLLLVMAGYGLELLWIAQGSHPNNLSQVTPGSAKEADQSEGADLIIAGLANSDDANARLWREQAAISEIITLGVGIPETPTWGELTNRVPMEFDDDERGIRWVFSHDLGRFVGYGLNDKRPIGELGVQGVSRFPSPPLPGPHDLLIGRDTLHQYDRETQRVLPRWALPAGEVIAGIEVTGEQLLVLSDRALYFLDLRPLALDDAPLQTQQRLPLPGATGNLQRVDAMELLDGHLVSFTMTRLRHNGQGRSYQQLKRVDEQGRVQNVARRELGTGYGPLYTWQTWWLSPAISRTLAELRPLFAPYQPGYALDPPPRPGVVNGLALGLMAISLLLGLLRVRRTALAAPARVSWCVACAVVGLPALMALWWMVPLRERVAPRPSIG